MFKPGDLVTIQRDINRVPSNSPDRSFVPYAKKGEKGVIKEIFKEVVQGPCSRVHAKVVIEGQIKTFRLTSLRKVR